VGAGLVIRALEQWLSSGVVALDALDAALQRNRHRPGCRTVAEIVRTRILAGAEPDSPAEGRLGRVLSRAGIGGLVHHFVVTVASGRTFELDWCIPALKLGFEMDGYGVHLRSLEQFERDRVRRNELEIDGWQILNFTRRQVERTPERVVEQVERAVRGRFASSRDRVPARDRREMRDRFEIDAR
jgi:very-short-patch-repair endonuclease